MCPGRTSHRDSRREDVVVIVRGDKIAAVGASGAVEVPPGARVIDLGGQTLLPGLIDAHAHVSVRVDSTGIEGELAGMAQPGTQQMTRVPRNLRIQLLSGVTSAYVVGETQNIDVYTRQAVGRGLFSGPWEFRRMVRRQVEAGAHHIKLMVINGRGIGPNSGHPFEEEALNFTRGEIEAAVDEAHRLGVRVTAHASGAAARPALEAGADSIQHAGGLDDELIDVFLAQEAGSGASSTTSGTGSIMKQAASWTGSSAAGRWSGRRASPFHAGTARCALDGGS